jgi:hypothetical protein
MVQFAISYHELTIAIVAAVIVFVLCKTIGTWIECLVQYKFKTTHAAGCSDCGEIRELRIDVKAIPDIIKNQHDLRGETIPRIERAIAENTIVTKRLSENIDKLFELWEEEWKGEIQRLRALGIS